MSDVLTAEEQAIKKLSDLQEQIGKSAEDTVKMEASFNTQLAEKSKQLEELHTKLEKQEEANKTALEEQVTKLKAEFEKQFEQASEEKADIGEVIQKALIEDEEDFARIIKSANVSVTSTLNASMLVTKAIGAADFVSDPDNANDFLSRFNSTGTVFTKRNPFNILDKVNLTFSTDSNSNIYWVEQDGEAGEAQFIEDCALKPEVKMNFIEKDTKYKKVAAYTCICDRILSFVPLIANFLRDFLETKLIEAINQALITGDSSVDALQPDGIATFAGAFIPTDVTESIEGATMIDALNASIAQLECFYCMPDCIMINCVDKFKLLSIKNKDCDYISNTVLMMDGSGNLTLGGVPIIVNNYVPAGSFIVGDFTKMNVRMLSDITTETGRNLDDFRRDQTSMRSYVYLASWVACEYYNCFLYETFANVIGSIDKPA